MPILMIPTLWDLRDWLARAIQNVGISEKKPLLDLSIGKSGKMTVAQ